MDQPGSAKNLIKILLYYFKIRGIKVSHCFLDFKKLGYQCFVRFLLGSSELAYLFLKINKTFLDDGIRLQNYFGSI